MEDSWLSVEQVADRLGLHVRTVRSYIRDGRLKAVRIGKQYRISPGDLAALTGITAAVPLTPRVEVSSVVEIDEISMATADRLSTLLVAGAQLAPDLRIRTIYDDARHRLKLIVLGSPASTAEILRTLDEVLQPESGLLND
ncbi:helix-turn-helix domain-containing protein [Winogradskya consettensis]|uniref:MerR family transcriptional regulator n=1 Tax=Winogradskya consettensis TaxID=113560 RepID=A0A919VIS7_9ACTN|nr:helix-turn-helix domain-containing protein [Actinoplanes consettensis]GIM67427.1 MerR family transcriptional regulator [Actinoplanes consettensis]